LGDTPIEHPPTALEDLALYGLSDWLNAAWVSKVAGDHLASKDERLTRHLALGLIVDLLAAGLVEVGDVDGGVLHPWSCTPGEAVIRIANEWRRWGDHHPTPGAVAWIELTDSGRELGEAVKERERARRAERGDGGD
jgi:hypothetical protein